MATEVLLMGDVKDLGSEGDVVKVADGYARNYLLPSKLAAPVTEATKRRLVKVRRDREAATVAEQASARALAAKLADTSCTIAVKVGGDGKLYGSVTPGDIEEQLKSQGIEIDKHQIELEQPIKELGVFDVKIRLHPDVESSVKVWIVEE